MDESNDKETPEGEVTENPYQPHIDSITNPLTRAAAYQVLRNMGRNPPQAWKLKQTEEQKQAALSKAEAKRLRRMERNKRNSSLRKQGQDS